MSSAHSSHEGGFGGVVSHFARAKRQDVADPEWGMGVEHTEVLRRELVGKYRNEVFTPRMELWNAFNTFLKASQPTWVNPLILEPKKPHGDEARDNQYSSHLAVARWDFKHTSPDQQVETALSVHGWQIFDDDFTRKSLADDLPKPTIGTFVLGRNRTIRENYLEDRIQAINGYVVHATIHNLEADESRLIHFSGQDGFDTFVTLSQLQEAQKSYTDFHQKYGGKEYRTRPATFQPYFTAPIETPIELVDPFMVRHGADGVDIAGTIKQYAYLFDQKPCARFYGEVSIADGNDLFYYRGDETLAYMQAGALLEFMQGMSLVKASDLGGDERTS